MDYIILIIALVAVVYGADNLVSGSADIARRFKISDFVIGAIIVGVGTSFPELIVSSMGAIEGKVDVAIGNVVGSNIFNIAFILGVSSQITPLFSSGITIVDYAVMIAAAVLLLMFSLNNKISRTEGAIMLTSFVAYNIYLIYTQTI